jgi:hypothetical protein
MFSEVRIRLLQSLSVFRVLWTLKEHIFVLFNTFALLRNIAKCAKSTKKWKHNADKLN